MRLGRGEIKSLGVLLHHPMGIEHRGDTAERFTPEEQQGERELAVGRGVVGRDELVVWAVLKAGSVN